MLESFLVLLTRDNLGCVFTLDSSCDSKIESIIGIIGITASTGNATPYLSRGRISILCYKIESRKSREFLSLLYMQLTFNLHDSLCSAMLCPSVPVPCVSHNSPSSLTVEARLVSRANNLFTANPIMLGVFNMANSGINLDSNRRCDETSRAECQPN